MPLSVKTVAMPTMYVSEFRFLDFVCCHRLGFLTDSKPVD